MATNERTNVKLFPTAVATDVLFYVQFSSDLPKNRVPEYGTSYRKCCPHAAEEFPNHKLVFISPADENGLQKWYFAADRENQDEYNWEWKQADIAGTKFNFVNRTYVTLRTESKPLDPLEGAAMPDTPTGKFDSGYILGGRGQTKAIEELNSLFVAELREYFQRAPMTDISTDPMLGVGQAAVTTLHYRGEVVGGSAIEALVADPSNAYWGVQSDGTVRDQQQVSDNWFAVITQSSLDAALAAYHFSLPTTTDLDIPDELVSVATVWNTAGQNGSFTTEAKGRSAYVGDPEVSLGLSESANAECGGSVQPEIIPVFRRRNGRDLPATAWFFYIKQPDLSLANILTKLSSLAGSVTPWPIFQPTSHTIVLKGQRGSGRAQVSASGSVSTQKNGTEERNNKEVSSGKGDSYDYSTSYGTVVLQESIHPAITISNTTPPAGTYTAECTVGWDSTFTAATVATYNIALPVPSSSGAGNLDPSSGGSGTVTKTATVTLGGSVTPTTLAATTPTAIPVTGKYLVGPLRIEPYKAKWFRCHAIVFDATELAP